MTTSHTSAIPLTISSTDHEGTTAKLIYQDFQHHNRDLAQAVPMVKESNTVFVSVRNLSTSLMSFLIYF